MALAENVYKVVRKLPDEEKFSLTDQMKRCAVSIPSNIAEGHKRLGPRETIQFCGIALGSNAELQTQLLLATRLYSIDTSSELKACEDVARMLSGLIKALRAKL
jgi:four helix bundle protein